MDVLVDSTKERLLMKRALRLLGFCFLSLVAVVALAGALFGCFIYSPAPALPRLSGTSAKGSIEVDGLKRTYLSYLPQGLAKGAPLVLVMHGSGETGARIGIETGYGFERLADEHGFAVVYPDSYSFDWNDCGKVGDYTEKGREVDDVEFLDARADRLISELGLDRGRAFATGVSAGGFMSLRLALEVPSRFRAVAAVAANVQTPENFKCKPAGTGTSIMIMNGTKDPWSRSMEEKSIYSAGSTRAETSGRHGSRLNTLQTSISSPAPQKRTTAQSPMASV